MDKSRSRIADWVRTFMHIGGVTDVPVKIAYVLTVFSLRMAISLVTSFCGVLNMNGCACFLLVVLLNTGV